MAGTIISDHLFFQSSVGQSQLSKIINYGRCKKNIGIAVGIGELPHFISASLWYKTT